jgi:hypothetical protein
MPTQYQQQNIKLALLAPALVLSCAASTVVFSLLAAGEATQPRPNTANTAQQQPEKAVRTGGGRKDATAKAKRSVSASHQPNTEALLHFLATQQKAKRVAKKRDAWGLFSTEGETAILFPPPLLGIKELRLCMTRSAWEKVLAQWKAEGIYPAKPRYNPLFFWVCWRFQRALWPGISPDVLRRQPRGLKGFLILPETYALHSAAGMFSDGWGLLRDEKHEAFFGYLRKRSKEPDPAATLEVLALVLPGFIGGEQEVSRFLAKLEKELCLGGLTYGYGAPIKESLDLFPDTMEVADDYAAALYYVNRFKNGEDPERPGELVADWALQWLWQPGVNSRTLDIRLAMFISVSTCREGDFGLSATAAAKTKRFDVVLVYERYYFRRQMLMRRQQEEWKRKTLGEQRKTLHSIIP